MTRQSTRHYKFLLTIGTILLLWGAGCAKVGPDFRAPCAYVQEGWTEGSPALDSGCDSPQRWWCVLEDPVLDYLMETAATQNLSLEEACWRIAEARAFLSIAFGELFPQQQALNGAAQRVHLSKNTPNSFGDDLKYYLYQFNLQVAWELDFWGRYRRGVEAAQQHLCAAYATFDDVMVLLLGDVAARYSAVRALQERLAVLEANGALQGESLALTRRRRAAGQVTDLDVLQAEALWSETQSLLPKTDKELRHQVNALAMLLGTTPSAMTFLLQQPAPLPTAPATLCVGVPARLLTRRPDIGRALHDAAAQSALIGVAAADLLPSLSLAGVVGFVSSGDTMSTWTGTGGDLFSADSFNFVGGPQFNWPVLNYGRLTGRVDVEVARFQRLLYAYQDRVLLAQREVEDGMATFAYSQEEASRLADGVAALRQAEQLARELYGAGAVDYARLYQAQRALLSQQQELVRARGDILLGLVVTYKALGGGW